MGDENIERELKKIINAQFTPVKTTSSELFTELSAKIDEHDKAWRKSRDDFLNSVNALKNSTENERRHHLAAAHTHSANALNHLIEIEKLAEKINDDTLKNLAISIMNDVLTIRKKIGLKNE